MPVSADSQPEIKARMFVAAANTNSIFVLGASETGDLTKLETINLSLTQRQALGTTPSALALSADKSLVYVACSGINAIAAIDITGSDRNLVKGFIPTGAYPTAVLGLPDGGISVLNGYGSSVQLMDTTDDAKLLRYSDEVMASFPYRDENLDAPEAPAGNPVRAGGPIKHVVYIVRGDDSAELTAGIQNDYMARLGNRFARDGAPDPANVPPAGYLWDAAAQAGLKIRNYGFQVHNLAKPNVDGEQIDRVYDPALTASTDMEYRGPDPAYSDVERAKEFAGEIGEYGQLGEMPQLLLVRIGADDQAENIIEDAVAKSKFSGETAIFVAVQGKVARVRSPWTTRAATVGSNELSGLRTAEIILGLRPMTIFDAAAKPMFDAFTTAPAQ